MSARDFVPGAVVAGRFRIVALLGRGGMGEVYRTEDLRLRDTVALKFLPVSLAQDPEARSRLEQEVRLARRVTHPHVCRVFDVVEADGALAISMEYVDGEDLASLLRRVGHLPSPRGLQVARQIVLGVGAIHRQGLLHRDLKPANVMIDGRGGARLMDFGLAAEGPDGLFCGTPAYMAPEQLAGGPASVQSDLFALALVLHELFTGETVFAPRTTLAELRHDRATVEPRSLDSLALGLPQRLVEVLGRCLARSPADRPRSTSELLAALPGGDGIAEALAAGETPSPETVAGGGPDGYLSARVASRLLLVAAVGLAVFFALVDQVSVVGRVAPRLSRDVLAERARALLANLRGEPPRGPAVSGFASVEPVGGEPVSAAVWRRWGETDRGPFAFIYAQPRSAVDPDDLEEQRRVGLRGLAGEAAVVLTLRGNLRRLTISPGLPATPGAGAAMSWTELLAAAGLPPTTLRDELPSERFVPPMFADERHVWRAELPGGEELRVYGAALDGAPVYLTILPAAAPPPGSTPTVASGFELDIETFFKVGTLLLLALGGWLAWNNVRAGRADRIGAMRLAVVVLLLEGAVQGVASLVASPGLRGQLALTLFSLLQLTVMVAVIASLLYLGLEPSVRRRRPRAAVAWTRLLRGQLGDPLVAREVLVGLSCGGVLVALWAAEQWTVQRFGLSWYMWEPVFSPGMLDSPLDVIAAFAGALPISGVTVFIPLVVWAWLSQLLRSPVAAEVVAVLLMAGLVMLFTAGGPGVANLLFGAILAILSLRVGIVAAIAMGIFWPIVICGAYTLDGSRFYFANTIVVVRRLRNGGPAGAPRGRASGSSHERRFVATAMATAHSTHRVGAVVNEGLEAVLHDLQPLRYSDGTAAADDVPLHVRAASAVRRHRSRLVIFQDDVNVLALRDAAGQTEALLLPAGPAGRRSFDEGSGNKHAKMDLEACAALPDGRLVAFGSGSTPARERLVVHDGVAPSVIDGASLYAILRATPDFSGSELNLEGALVVGDVLRLFQRGNGTRVSGLDPVNAIGDLSLSRFIHWLDTAGPPPGIERILQVDLGCIGTVAFTFTDAALATDGRIAFVACAEASPDAIRDGAVLGCRFGFLDGGEVAVADVRSADGRPTLLKLEGIESRPDSPWIFDVVADVDCPDEPALLGRLEIRGSARIVVKRLRPTTEP